jgi:hypothetical protein
MNPLLLKNSAIQSCAAWVNPVTNQLMDEWQDMTKKQGHCRPEAIF